MLSVSPFRSCLREEPLAQGHSSVALTIEEDASIFEGCYNKITDWMA
jgi:hypothetical protein